VVLQTDYDKIELQKISYDVTSKLWFYKLIMTKSNFKKSIMTSFCDIIAITSPKNVTKITSQNFSILPPSQSKSLATPVLPMLSGFLPQRHRLIAVWL